MKVTYLNHSGYVVEEGDTVLVFDYYKGSLPEISRQAKIYVFASHAHYDHFDEQIFKWERQYQDIHYILSDDIKVNGPEGKCTYIGPGQRLKFDDIEIRTLCSTDEGVAFLVRLNEKAIYHAGDLNWWHWEEEGKVYNEMMRRRYQCEIGKIEGERIDVAFVPLDPRQEEQYSLGFDYFMRHTRTAHAFPMHMWDQYDICDKLLRDPISAPYREQVMCVSEPQQAFLV